MRLLYFVVAVALLSAGCSSLRVRCDARLRPINIAPPTSQAPISGERSLSGAKP